MACYGIARWEKVVYAILFVLLLILFIFSIYGLCVWYTAHPGNSKNELKHYDPFRYPYIIYCEESTGQSEDAKILAEALTMPSRPSKQAVAQVEKWEKTKLEEAMKSMGSKGPAIRNLAPKCTDLSPTCKIGEATPDCCANETQIVTEYGSCLLIDIGTEMNVNAKPIESLSIELSPQGDSAWIGVADHHQFFNPTWIKVYKGDSHQMGLESAMFDSIEGIRQWFGDDGPRKKPFDKETANITRVTSLNKNIRKKCGCEFSYFGQGGCDVPKDIDCVKPVLEEYLSGKEVKKYHRDGQHYYKLFARGTHATGGDRIQIEMRYESEFVLVSRIYLEATLNTLIYLIGSHLAVYLSIFIIIFIIIQCCKGCCRCCRAEEKTMTA